jgi:hypothetical protein
LETGGFKKNDLIILVTASIEESLKTANFEIRKFSRRN